MSTRKNKSKSKFRPIRKNYFEVLIDFYTLTWGKKDTLKLDYSLLDDSKLESLGLWWLKRVVRTYMHKDSFD